LFLVPAEALRRGRKVRIAVDPQEPDTPYLVRKHGVLQLLKPAVQEAGKSREKSKAKPRQEPAGSLTPLLHKYRGRTLPQAWPGFGLPEIYQAFTQALGRAVPNTEQEATTILDWLGQRGPFDPEAFRRALSKTLKRLGEGRPLGQVLEALNQRIRPRNNTGRQL
jgi:hypothetical protein